MRVKKTFVKQPESPITFSNTGKKNRISKMTGERMLKTIIHLLSVLEHSFLWL